MNMRHSSSKHISPAVDALVGSFDCDPMRDYVVRWPHTPAPALTDQLFLFTADLALGLHTFVGRTAKYLIGALVVLGFVPLSYPQTQAVNLCVFDDGYTNMEGPSDAIFISGRNANNEQGKACIPGGQFGHCHKWFGRCQTPNTAWFYVFNDERGNSVVGPADAVYIPKDGNQACIPDGTSTGTCRRWFGQMFTGDGRSVTCDVFDDRRGTSVAGPTDAIYVPHPIPSPGSACMPDQTATGTCHRWFGQCSTSNGTPIAYREVITGPPGWPSGTLGAVAFGGASGNVKLILSLVGNTANVVPFAVPSPAHASDPDIGINDGTGFENVVGAASIAIQDAGNGALLAAGNFLPQAGIFVSADNGNRGIGFGSLGALPPDPRFPDHGVEVAYPYALFSAPPADLQNNYNFPASPWALSCAGFSGSPGPPGPPGSTCNAPIALGTTGGTLTIVSDNQVDPPPTGSFSATTVFYTLSVPPLTPSPVRSSASATSTVALTPFGGFNGNVALGCKVVAIDALAGGTPPPGCTLSSSQVAINGTSTLTVVPSNQTPTGTYAVVVTGDSAGQAPGNGAQTVPLTVLQNGAGDVAIATFAGLLVLWGMASLWWHRTRALR
jgi:hypothetical protein